MAETTVISPHDQSVLVNRLRAGDVEAFTEIYNHYTGKAIDWAYNVLEDREKAKDIAQDVLLWLWVNRDKLKPDTHLNNFIYGSVRHAVLNVIRHGKVKARVFDQAEKRIWGETTTENMVLQRELQQKLRDAIAELPELAQEVYRLSREEHLTYQEIADRLSLRDAKAVENQLGRAMKKIRNSLGDFLPLILFFLTRK